MSDAPVRGQTRPPRPRTTQSQVLFSLRSPGCRLTTWRTFLDAPDLHQVRQVPVVLAEVLSQLGVGLRRRRNRVGVPGARVRLWIIDGGDHFHAGEVHPAETLRRPQRVGVRMALVRQPAALLEPGALGDERVTVPAAN